MALETRSSLDEIVDLIGNFGPYQRRTFLLTCIGMVIVSSAHVAYVFTAKDLNYRCRVPECELTSSSYDQPWISNAIPTTNGIPEKCTRYALANTSYKESMNTCPEKYFNRSNTIPCDHFVYERNERSIIVDFNLHCNDNLWKLTTVGTVNTIGMMVGLPISGFISDRYGRKILFVSGLVLCGLFGLCRILATSYAMFLAIEFIESAADSGVYACGFILGLELIGPQHRLLGGGILSSSFALGELLAAMIAWLLPDWRYFREKIIKTYYSEDTVV